MTTDSGLAPPTLKPPTDEVVLSVRDLKVGYASRSGWFAHRRMTTIVRGVSFDLHKGETLGLVGESGCGKSTLARGIVRLAQVLDGEVRLRIPSEESRSEKWAMLSRLEGRSLRDVRPHIQLVFQDPFASLNPRMTVGDIVAEPLILQGSPRKERQRRIGELMDRVGLGKAATRRYPHQFSGGQRQRIGIARAIATRPAVLVCDEPVSALDVSIRSEILNLLVELQQELGLSYVFIAHDLAVVKRISHRVMVMYLGKVVEAASYDQIYTRCLHPYTRSLLAAIPIPDPVIERKRPRLLLEGDLPILSEEREGCDFASRCPSPWKRLDCHQMSPMLAEVELGHRASCLEFEPCRPRSLA